MALVNCEKKFAQIINAIIKKAEKNRLMCSLLSGFFISVYLQNYSILHFIINLRKFQEVFITNANLSLAEIFWAS